MPYVGGHSSSHSTSAISVDSGPPGAQGQSTYGYAPSTYAASTLAASTIMPSMLMQPVSENGDMVWVEGHCMVWAPKDNLSVCSICDEKADLDGTFGCTGCSVTAHARCLGQLSLVCPSAFNADRVRAAFVRCFASLLYTYRKSLKVPNREQKKGGQIFGFDMEGFSRSLPGELAEYVGMMKQTQGMLLL